MCGERGESYWLISSIFMVAMPHVPMRVTIAVTRALFQAKMHLYGIVTAHAKKEEE
jgi:hypothetical protein